MDIVAPPEDMFDSSSRTMVILAHQDDESTFAGLVRRLPSNARFVWVTNGDGLSDQLGMDDSEYADVRRKETVRAMEIAGIGNDRLRFLAHGEKEIYAQMASLDDSGNSGNRAGTLSCFRDIASRVAAEVATFRPDFIVTHAWQGGQPEHDLTHVMAVLAARDVRGCKVYEVPEYELAYSVFLRFPFWKRGPVHEIILTRQELDIKKQMVSCYRTQRRGMIQVSLLVAAGGVLERTRSMLKNRRFRIGPFAAREYFAPVPSDRNYRMSPHGIDHLEYIGDDWQKKPVSFSKMVLPIVCAIEQ